MKKLTNIVLGAFALVMAHSCISPENGSKDQMYSSVFFNASDSLPGFVAGVPKNVAPFRAVLNKDNPLTIEFADSTGKSILASYDYACVFMIPTGSYDSANPHIKDNELKVFEGWNHLLVENKPVLSTHYSLSKDEIVVAYASRSGNFTAHIPLDVTQNIGIVSQGSTDTTFLEQYEVGSSEYGYSFPIEPK